MPDTSVYPLGGNGDILQDLIRRVEILEARARVIQNGAINFVGSNGKPVVTIGSLSDGTYGVEIFDANGNVVTKLGQLDVSPAIYGLGVLPHGGTTLQQVGGAIAIQASDVLNTTVTSWTNFGGTSSLSTVLGPSGKALVTVSCNVQCSNPGASGLVGVAIDSNTFGGWVGSNCPVGATGGSTDTTSGSTQLVTGLSAGSHTFQLQYETDGTACSFQTTTMVVQPL